VDDVIESQVIKSTNEQQQQKNIIRKEYYPPQTENIVSNTAKINNFRFDLSQVGKIHDKGKKERYIINKKILQSKLKAETTKEVVNNYGLEQLKKRQQLNI
jgi:hypothetical protein